MHHKSSSPWWDAAQRDSSQHPLRIKSRTKGSSPWWFYFVNMSIFSGHSEPWHCVLLSAARWAESSINHRPSSTALLPVLIPWGLCIYHFSQQHWWAISVFLVLGRGKGIKQHKMESSGLQKFADLWLKWPPQLSITQWVCFGNAGISIKLLRFIYNIINVLKRNASVCLSFGWWMKVAPGFGSWM